MSLAALYVYAIVTPNPAQRLIFMVLSLLLAFALWQKARDQLPYLLDPDASPPARVSTSDGLIAAMLFFVAQAVGGGRHHRPRTRNRCHGTDLVLHRWRDHLRAHALGLCESEDRRSAAHPRRAQPSAARDRRRPGRGGRRDALSVSRSIDSGCSKRRRATASRTSSSGCGSCRWRVVAAPVFEEFIFRGLIFGGLRRSFGVWPATLASAAVFAIVHPPLAVTAGVRARRVHGTGVRTHPQPAGADDHARGVQRLRDRRSDLCSDTRHLPSVSVRRPLADPQVIVCS